MGSTDRHVVVVARRESKGEAKAAPHALHRISPRPKEGRFVPPASPVPRFTPTLIPYEYYWTRAEYPLPDPQGRSSGRPPRSYVDEESLMTPSP